MASAPNSCVMRALAASQAFGSTRMRPGPCSARNCDSLSLCVLMDGSLLCLYALRQDRTGAADRQPRVANSRYATGDLAVPMVATTAAEHLNFLRGLILRPKNVGAVAPSSPALARAIAAQVDTARPGPVLELGPGTGVVTEAVVEHGVAEERLIAIEYDADFAKLVAQRFPRARII